MQLERLQDDGATLAELVSKTSTIYQSSKGTWVYRYRESTKHGKVDGYIDRRFWFRASIIKSDAELMEDTVEVNLSSDSDSIGSDKHLDWQAKFCESELKYHKYPFTKNGEGNYVSTSDTGGANDLHCEVCLDTCTLDEWIASSLDTSQVKVVSCEDPEKVQFKIDRKKNETKSKEDFRKWIYSSLRKFDWINFENDLLKRSPRELATDFDKTYTYGLSSKLNLRSITDIDYFISHSWNDNAGHKIRALRKFFRSFQFLYNRGPVVWLDKVCTDQRKPDDAIAALPLIICSCNKVLVMMSDSYMKRLWCVWELFTLFSFCSKEVAVDRLELVALGDKTEEANIKDAIKNLKNFNIDNAQCFDPNEEQKLRIIMKQIGTDRLKNGLDGTAKMLKDKLDHNIKKQLEID